MSRTASAVPAAAWVIASGSLWTYSLRTGPRLIPRMSAAAKSHSIPIGPARSGRTNDWAKIIPIATNPRIVAVPGATSRPMSDPTARKAMATPTSSIT